MIWALRLSAMLSCVASLAACSSSPSTTSRSEKQIITGPQYPKGVATDAASLRATEGIYTGDTLCCWLKGDAKFFVSAPAHAHALVVQAYEATNGPLAKISQAVTLTGANASQGTTKPMHGGRETLVFPIEPSSITNGMVAVDLHMAHTFVPKTIGLNGDVRPLSIILESITAK